MKRPINDPVAVDCGVEGQAGPNSLPAWKNSIVFVALGNFE